MSPQNVLANFLANVRHERELLLSMNSVENEKEIHISHAHLHHIFLSAVNTGLIQSVTTP